MSWIIKLRALILMFFFSFKNKSIKDSNKKRYELLGYTCYIHRSNIYLPKSSELDGLEELFLCGENLFDSEEMSESSW